MKTKTKIINLFGGPGAGKSTTMSGLFYKMKMDGMNVEFASEYAKDLAYEKTIDLLQNQMHVFAEQFRRQWRLIDQVDFIITDSPLILSSVYYELYMENSRNKIFPKDYRDQTVQYFDDTFKQFNNINWFITRNKPYVGTGRIQTEEQAKELDLKILQKLQNKEQKYFTTDSQNSVNDIYNWLKAQ